jgi:L-rhamnose mutarotase
MTCADYVTYCDIAIKVQGSNPFFNAMSGRRPKSLSAIIDDLLNRISKFVTLDSHIFSFLPINMLFGIFFRKDDYNIFAELVSKELYPHYWQTVANPTAISVMREKNNRSFYRNLDDFKVCRGCYFRCFHIAI